MKKIRQQHLREVRAGKRGCPPGLGAAERGVQHPHHPIIPCLGSPHVQLADFSQAGIANGDSVLAWGRSGIVGRGMGGAFRNDRSCLAAISGPQRPCALLPAPPGRLLSPIPALQAGAAGHDSCCVWAGGCGWAPGGRAGSLQWGSPGTMLPPAPGTARSRGGGGVAEGFPPSPG